MKTNYSNLLPKMPSEITNGGLYLQAVRCGKVGCRCASGQLHEGYYYFIRRVNGRLRKTYVPKHQVNEVALIIEQATNDRKTALENRRSSQNLLSKLRDGLRNNEPMIRNLAAALRYED